MAKKAVSLRRRCLFCILYVICGIFARFSEKIEKPRKLHGFGAIFWAPWRRKRGPRRVCPANWQKCRVFGRFCKKARKVRAVGPFSAESGVLLGRGGVFCTLYVICGVFALFSEKLAISPQFLGVLLRFMRYLRRFCAMGRKKGLFPRVSGGLARKSPPFTAFCGRKSRLTRTSQN